MLDTTRTENVPSEREGQLLKEAVRWKIFPQLAEGFLASRTDASRTRVDEATLAALFTGTLTLLYRLLFLLCAEGRGLLPVREPGGYSEISLTRLAREAAESVGVNPAEVEAELRRRYSDDSYELYERLRHLFGIIAEGDEALKVNGYCGGLFMDAPPENDESRLAQAASFLRSNRISDRRLARALNLLARVSDERGERLAFVDYGSLGVRHLGSIYEALLECKLRVARRRLCIVTARGREVHADLDGLDQKRRMRAEAAGRVIEEGQLYLERDVGRRRATGSYYTPDNIVRYLVERTVGPVLDEKLEALRPRLRQAQGGPKGEGQALVREFFDLKVLDPACGSGHFLVQATRYVAERMLSFLKGSTHNPVTAYLSSMRARLVRANVARGLTIEEGRLTELGLLKRLVLKRCTYGVDLDPMALELAKLSLWLDCCTPLAPLPFLDQHLRCGNLLTGAHMREAGACEDAKLRRAAHLARRASERPDLTAAQVARSRAEHDEAARTLAPLKRALDLYTNRWFGANRPKSFFHSEAEFADLFHGARRAGFDVVIGNPPWGARLDQYEKRFYRERFRSVASGKIDSFALFIERATQLTRRGGYMGFLLPDVLLLKNYPAARFYILSHQRIVQIVHWGRPFSHVNLDACSIVSARENEVADETPLSCVVESDGPDGAENILTHGLFRRNEAYKFNLFLNERLRGALAVASGSSEPLSSFLEFHEGIHSGNVREKLFVDRCDGPRSRPLIFGGQEVRPFLVQWKGRHVVYDPFVVNRARGEYANLGREGYFLKPKLLVRRTGDSVIAAADYERFFASNNLFVAQARAGCCIPLEFFEGLLNSDLSTWYFRGIQPRRGRLFSELKIVHLHALPVPRSALANHLAEILDLVRVLRKTALDGIGPGDSRHARARRELNYIFLSCAGLGPSDIA